jgi:hypothetical protein
MCACKKVQRDLQAMIDQLDAIAAVYRGKSLGNKPLAGLLEWLAELRRQLTLFIVSLNTC